jgi:dihydrofolate synthase/folylpolyglutamate synthase
MGGRLDATNIVNPLITLITNIQFDHQRWLGDTLPQIAFEKAGIIKPGIPVVTGVEDPTALNVISQVAADKTAPLHRATLQTIPLANSIPLSLQGTHQRKNAALVLKTVELLQPQFSASDTVVAEALRATVWAGRLQLLCLSNGRRILLDGAHNVDGVKALRSTLEENFSAEAKTLILGIFADKSWSHMLQELAPLASRIILSPVQSQRTTSPADLATRSRQINPAAEVIECSSLAEALAGATADSFVVISGSLHFIGEAMELLEVHPQPALNERALNEWNTLGPR